MIRRFNESDFEARQDIILNIAKDMGQGQLSPEQMFEYIKTPFKEGKLEICGYFDEYDKSLLGLVFLGHTSKIISWLHVDEKATKHDEAKISEIQRALVDEALVRLAAEEYGIAAYGRYVTDDISAILMSAGFRKYDRASMDVPRTRIESIDRPILPDGYILESYDSDRHQLIANLIHKSNEGEIDVRVFPEFFRSLDACENFIKQIRSNSYGQYHQESSMIARLKDEIVGACFITIRGTTGYIPEISVSPNHRRKGLGYALIIHSLKTLLESDHQIDKIALDVTLANSALRLYERIGFEKAQDYSMYRYPPKDS